MEVPHLKVTGTVPMFPRKNNFPIPVQFSLDITAPERRLTGFICACAFVIRPCITNAIVPLNSFSPSPCIVASRWSSQSRVGRVMEGGFHCNVATGTGGWSRRGGHSQSRATVTRARGLVLSRCLYATVTHQLVAHPIPIWFYIVLHTETRKRVIVKVRLEAHVRWKRRAKSTS